MCISMLFIHRRCEGLAAMKPLFLLLSVVENARVNGIVLCKVSMPGSFG